MSLSVIDANCINCAVSISTISSENPPFNQFTIIDEIDRLDCPEETITVLDAILHIYGFSVTYLASVHLEEPTEENVLPCTTISEICAYFVEHGLYLCSHCVSVFKQLYVACQQLKKLSSKAALLTKAIKKFAPSSIKVEVDKEEPGCTIKESSQSEDFILPINLRSDFFPHGQFSSVTNQSETEEAEDLCQVFNFDNDDDNGEYDDNDVKPDGIDERQNCWPSTTYLKNFEAEDLINNGAIKRRRGNPETYGVSVSVRRKSGHPRKSKEKPPTIDDSHGPFSLNKVSHMGKPASTLSRLINDDKKSIHGLKQDGLRTLSVKLVRIEEQKQETRRGTEPIHNLKRIKRRQGSKKRVVKTRNRRRELKIQQNDSTDKDSESDSESDDNGAKCKNRKEKPKDSKSCDEKAIILKCGCGKVFNKLERLRLHEKSHESQEPVTCATCGETFETNYLLYVHRSRVHSELPGLLFQCDKCGRKFTAKTHLKEHVRKHGNECRLTCRTKETSKRLYCRCGKHYINLQSLRFHEETHESLEPVICDVCGETFAKSYKLYAHKSMQHSEMPHLIKKCNLCDAKFLKISNLKIHMDRFHSSKSFICEVCGKSYKCLPSLKLHSLIHKDESVDKESFKCPVCGIYLKHTYGLKKHMYRVHGPQKTFTCGQCGQTTKTLTNMKVHMKIHDPNCTEMKTTVPSITRESS